MRPAVRSFEDFAVGLRFRSFEAIALGAERIKSFAAEFDPQPFHLDDAAGPETFFGGLVASGWHVAAVAMRVEGTVIETRPSRSRADCGIVKFQITVYNQSNEAVLEATHVVMALRRG